MNAPKTLSRRFPQCPTCRLPMVLLIQDIHHWQICWNCPYRAPTHIEPLLTPELGDTVQSERHPCVCDGCAAPR